MMEDKLLKYNSIYKHTPILDLEHLDQKYPLSRGDSYKSPLACPDSFGEGGTIWTCPNSGGCKKGHIPGLLLFFLLLFLLIITGCDLYPQDDYQEYYVVESYLIANQNLPRVILSRTLPVEEKYSFEKAAVSDAAVSIRLLDEEGSIEQRYPYKLQSRGIFIPVNTTGVLPGRRYELKVTFPSNDKELTAQTLVPGAFETTGVASDTVVYQSPEQITITTTRSYYPGRQSYFIFTVRALDPSEENMTPFYLDVYRDGDEELEDFTVNSSGIINEGNYDINPDNTLTLRVPWLAVAFTGDNEISANAIDDNMYDFLRSQEVQTGGGPSTLPPGVIQNVIYHVEGGIGIFGSMATQSRKVFVRRQQE